MATVATPPGRTALPAPSWRTSTGPVRAVGAPVKLLRWLAVALIAAATLSWPRLFAAGLLAGGLTTAAQGPSHAVWIWWVPIVAGLIVLLALTYPIRNREPVPVLLPSEARA